MCLSFDFHKTHSYKCNGILVISNNQYKSLKEFMATRPIKSFVKCVLVPYSRWHKKKSFNNNIHRVWHTCHITLSTGINICFIVFVHLTKRFNAFCMSCLLLEDSAMSFAYIRMSNFDSSLIAFTTSALNRSGLSGSPCRTPIFLNSDSYKLLLIWM